MTIYTGDDGNNTYTGQSTDDTLYGLGGNDTLDGAGGNDVIIGGLGSDTLTGGTGADIFLGTAAEMNGDTITDFLIGDRIRITDSNLNRSTANVSIVTTAVPAALKCAFKPPPIMISTATGTATSFCATVQGGSRTG